MVEQQGLNINVIDGDAFFANEVSVNFTPMQIALDFKCVTPRIDPRGKGRPTFLMRHNVVMLEPWHAKNFLEVLQDMMKKYEQEYGKIKKPEALEKAEKKQKSVKKSELKEDAPTYMG